VKYSVSDNGTRVPSGLEFHDTDNGGDTVQESNIALQKFLRSINEKSAAMPDLPSMPTDTA